MTPDRPSIPDRRSFPNRRSGLDLRIVERRQRFGPVLIDRRDDGDLREGTERRAGTDRRTWQDPGASTQP